MVNCVILCISMFVLLLYLNHLVVDLSTILNVDQHQMNSPDSTWKEMKLKGPVPASGPSQCLSDDCSCLVQAMNEINIQSNTSWETNDSTWEEMKPRGVPVLPSGPSSCTISGRPGYPPVPPLQRNAVKKHN